MVYKKGSYVMVSLQGKGAFSGKDIRSKAMTSDYDVEAMEKVVAFDFDGVIHQGVWTLAEEVNGEMVPGIRKVMVRLFELGYDIEVYTCRALTKAGRDAVVKWLNHHGLLRYVARVSASKPIAKVYIDDRAICFDGDVEGLIENVESFKSWCEEA